MLTLEELTDLPKNTVFKVGVTTNDENGVYMTDHRKGDKLLYVAKRGIINDWAIYVGWYEQSVEQVKNTGQKIYNLKNVEKLVPCTKEALERYRL
jgi:hypothetical protein